MSKSAGDDGERPCRAVSERQGDAACGDCLEVLATIPDNSIDLCVTDPPYHLASIVKRYGSPTAKPVRVGDINATNDLKAAHARSAAGFMGKQWDGGDVAFRPETWAEVYRVLKPGGYLLAFLGPGLTTAWRAQSRMRASRCGTWCRGFTAADSPSRTTLVRGLIKQTASKWGGSVLGCALSANGAALRKKSLRRIFRARREDLPGAWLIGNWDSIFPRLRNSIHSVVLCLLPFPYLEDLEREVVGTQKQGRLAVAPGQDNDRSQVELDITVPRTEAARQWQGWGTALKPALEPICMARKPLSEKNVAANVLRWGTGAINVDGCRVSGDESTERPSGVNVGIYGADDRRGMIRGGTNGRWPANVVHDGSEEVTAAFPAQTGAGGQVQNQLPHDSNSRGRFNGLSQEFPYYGDSGSAARFFFQAKADADDRLGSRHPTVKPVEPDAMAGPASDAARWARARPIQRHRHDRRGGWREGFKAILIEREAEISRTSAAAWRWRWPAR